MAAGRHANPRPKFSHRHQSSADELETDRVRDQYTEGRRDGYSDGRSHIRMVGKANRGHRCEDMKEMPPAKKSKLSFSTWDKEVAGVRVASKYESSSSQKKPHSDGDVHFNSVPIHVNDVCDDVDATVKLQDQGSMSKNDVEFRSVESTLTESPTLSPPLPRKDMILDECDMKVGFLVQDGIKIDDFGQENDLHISKSRWASDDDTPVHSSSGRKAHSLDAHISSPECGEFIRDDSEGGKSGSISGDRRENDGGAVINDECCVSQRDEVYSSSEDEITMVPRNVIWDSCRSVFDYERLNKINEGTYGVVYRARNKTTGEIVALKKVKLEGEREGFPITALREIKFLMSVDHPLIVRGKEIAMGDLDSIFVVMEYMEHDLKGMMEVMKHPFSISEVKCLMLQLLEGIQYLHDHWVIHRDLKSSNILFNNQGELKICDFGMARQYANPLKPYTALVVTLWYRAPEILFGAKQYSEAVDMWSIGCIMAELLSKEPLFQGKTEVDQIDKILRLLGTPNEAIWPGFSELRGAKAKFVKQPYNMLRKKFPVTSFTGSPALSDAGFDLLNRMLTYDPVKRITVHEALNHPWFQEVPLAKAKEFMPTYPAQNEKDRTYKQATRK